MQKPIIAVSVTKSMQNTKYRAAGFLALEGDTQLHCALLGGPQGLDGRLSPAPAGHLPSPWPPSSPRDAGSQPTRPISHYAQSWQRWGLGRALLSQLRLGASNQWFHGYHLP